jgi:oligosaccharide repeat unit polymerase
MIKTGSPENRWLLVLLLLSAACASIVLWNIGDYEGNLGFLLVLLALCLFPFLRGEPLESVKFFAFLFGMSIGLQGFMILRQDSIWIPSYRNDGPNYQSTLSFVFIFALIAIISAFAGYYSKLGVAAVRRLPQPKFFSASRSRIARVSLFAAFAALVGFYLFYQKCGGRAVWGDPGRIITEGIKEGGRLYFALLTEFGAIGFFFLYAYTLGRRRTFEEKVLLLLLFMIVCVNFLFGGMKSTIVGFVVVLAVLHHYIKKRFSYARMAVIAAVLIMILPLLNSYKKYGLYSPERIWKEYNPADIKFISLLTLSRSAGADMFFLTVDKTPEKLPFQYGRTFLRVISSFVPRPLWHDKPWSFGMEFNEKYVAKPGFIASVSPSTISELYINFSLPGVIIGFFIIGVFLRAMYQYCIASGVTREKTLIYAILMEKMIVLVDGPVADYTTFVLLRLFPLFVLVGLLKLTRTPGEIKKCQEESLLMTASLP